MILQSEILRIAEREGVPPDTVDKDWVLGHFLAELFLSDWAQQNLIFKGGTCLRKCYYKDYRFSEDLDFTLSNPNFVLSDSLMRDVCGNITEKSGILLHPHKIEAIVSDDQFCGYKIVINFWGANHKRNQQPTPPQRWLTSIKMEIIVHEKLVDMPNYRALIDDFSDFEQFAELRIPCYSISEILAEKFRSLLQRSYSAPRDYYDLWYILRFERVNWKKTIAIFKEKMIFKKIQFSGFEDFFEEKRLKNVKQEWKNSLQGHIRFVEISEVETVLSELKIFCQTIKWI